MNSHHGKARIPIRLIERLLPAIVLLALCSADPAPLPPHLALGTATDRAAYEPSPRDESFRSPDDAAAVADSSKSSLFILRTAEVPFRHVVVDASGPNDPHVKTVGDIDGDGFVDLVAASSTGGPLVWYQYPSWTKHIIAPSGKWSTDAEVGDVDGDGDQDVVISEWYANKRIEWYENPGRGAAAENWRVHVVGGPHAHDIEVGDLDGDGRLDIVGRSQTGEGNKIYIWRQNGLDSWTLRTIGCPTGEGLTIGDIDKDGDLDIIIGGRWYEGTKNIAAGAWTEHIFANWHPDAVVKLADMDQDGRPDVILTRSEGPFRMSWFAAPLDPKAGAWTEHVIDPALDYAHSLAIGDLDNDGDPDVVTAEMHQSQHDRVLVYLNQGGALAWQPQIVATTGSHDMRLADIGNDCDLDIYGANWSGGYQPIELWENLTNSSQLSLDQWQRKVIDPKKPWRAVFITSADMDGDGKKDIVTGGWWYKNPGGAGAWVRNSIGAPLNNMAAVYDFDGDGDMDILGTTGKGSDASPAFVWANNDGTGKFAIVADVSHAEGDFLQGVAIARFQPAGSPAVALSWHNGTGHGVQMLSVPARPAADTWPWRRISTQDQQEQLSAGDIDRDGDTDLLLGTSWLRNDGKAWSMQSLSTDRAQPDRNRLADINQDGQLDAVVGFLGISKPAKLVWYEQGTRPTGAWTEHVIASDVVGPMSLDVADMDHDGDLDVIVGEHNPAKPASAKLYIFENMDGHGGRWSRHVVAVGDEHHDGAQVVDIDGDGDLDIISIGWNNEQVLLYENKAIDGQALHPAARSAQTCGAGAAPKGAYLPIVRCEPCR